MSQTKVTFSLDSNLLAKIDVLIKNHVFKTRDQAIQTALQQTIDRLKRNRLARACAQLDKEIERKMADEWT